jgi:3-mercaptopyruvate sulfurtransferase SseA
MAGRLAVFFLFLFGVAASANEIPNPLIDYDAFRTNVEVVGELRKERRITEDEFIRMARNRDTVVLDARSAEKFAQLHIEGARNLSLPDMTEEELARVIPSKSTRILIYCNNNFLNEPSAFAVKDLAASLNVHTMNVLYAYGYTNVYELGPLIDINAAKLQFAGALK